MKPRMTGIKEFVKTFNTRIHWYGNDSKEDCVKARYAVLLHSETSEQADKWLEQLVAFMVERGFVVIAARTHESDAMPDYYGHSGRVQGKTWRLSVTYERDVSLVKNNIDSRPGRKH